MATRWFKRESAILCDSVYDLLPTRADDLAAIPANRREIAMHGELHPPSGYGGRVKPTHGAGENEADPNSPRSSHRWMNFAARTKIGDIDPTLTHRTIFQWPVA